MPKLPPKKQRKVEQYSRGAVGNFYSQIAWINLRNKQKREHPLCAKCLENGVLKDATGSNGVAEHIKPISEGGEALNQSNLQTLCNKCHSIKTGKETTNRRYK